MAKPFKVLVAYDGSAPAKKALADLERAGLPDGSRIRLLTAVVPWTRFAEPEGTEDSGWPSARSREQYRRVLESRVDAAREEARIIAAFLSSRHPTWRLEEEVVLDEAAQAILAQAGKWNPDLVVIGARGSTALGRILLGSVSEKVLHGRPAGIRIVRARIRRADRPRRILFGYDGSPGSKAALSDLAARYWPAGTVIRVVGVIEPLQEGGVFLLGSGLAPSEKDRDRRDRSRAAKVLDAAVAILGKAGLEAEAALIPGDARKVLLAEARRWGAECIFLGTRGQSGARRYLLGSVASAVATHADCTVEISGSRIKPGRARTGPGG